MFPGIVGQPNALEYLSRAIATQKIAPAYLFAGPDGVGRSLVAAQFITQLLVPTGTHPCIQNHPDSLWIAPTYKHKNQLLSVAQMAAKDIPLPRNHPQVRLAQIRDMIQFLSRTPLEATQLAVVIEGAETMAEAAANALLKRLEEPGNATLILLAPHLEALMPTLVSRCQRIPFRRLTPAQVSQVLTQVGHADILTHPTLLEMAQGSPGCAIAYRLQQQSIDPELLAPPLEQLQSPQACLRLAQQIVQTLDLPTQLWLLDYYLHQYWQTYGNTALLYSLEKAKEQLHYYAQPRLVWEIALLTLTDQQMSSS